MHRNKIGSSIINSFMTVAYTSVLVINVGVIGYIHYTNEEIQSIKKELQIDNREYYSSSSLWEKIDDEDFFTKPVINTDMGCEIIENRQKIIENAENLKADDKEFSKHIETRKELNNNIQSRNNCTLVRCTGYCDNGLTASGEWTRDGIAAGKREWLNKKIELFRVNNDGGIGEKIGDYVFKDTGAGIDTDGDGKGDSIIKGKSIDLWHSTEEACYSFSNEYGDYVYMSFID